MVGAIFGGDNGMEILHQPMLSHGELLDLSHPID
jgi:hypothetical protein